MRSCQGARPRGQDARRDRGDRRRLALGRPCLRGPEQRSRARQRAHRHRQRQRAVHRREPRRPLRQSRRAARDPWRSREQLLPHPRARLPLSRGRQRRPRAHRRARGPARLHAPDGAAYPHRKGPGPELCRGRSRVVAPRRALRRRHGRAPGQARSCPRRTRLRKDHGRAFALPHEGRSQRCRHIRRNALHHGVHPRHARRGRGPVRRPGHCRGARRDLCGRARQSRCQARLRCIRHLFAAHLRRALARSLPKRRSGHAPRLRVLGSGEHRPDAPELLRYIDARRPPQPALSRAGLR